MDFYKWKLNMKLQVNYLQNNSKSSDIRKTIAKFLPD